MSGTYVCRDWVPRNEYTDPIREKPAYRNSGIIKALTEDGEKIQVGRIVYESFENEEFQYIITPFWDIIDMLPGSVFQGIPGIDMELRLEHYYRVNYTPVFMTERSPGPNRVDLWELLDSVGLNYYDRLEWLIRTDLRAAVDNLIVERAREEVQISEAHTREHLRQAVNEGQYGDEIVIDNLQLLGRNAEESIKLLNRLMHYGIRLKSRQEGIDLAAGDYQNFLPVFAALHSMNLEKRKRSQRAGIQAAKEKGVYRGRKRKEVDGELLTDIIKRFQRKEIDLAEALELTQISKSTFYRRMREMKAK